MSDEPRPKRRAVAMVDRPDAVPAAAPKPCASCAAKDAALAAVHAELAQVRGSLLALQRLRG